MKELLKSKSFIDTILSCLWTGYLWFAKWEKDWFSYGNIDYGHYVVLKKGVYGVYITIKGKQYKGMANIGYNPTVGLIDNLSLEVNIFDCDQDIYGEDVDVDFVFRVEMKRNLNL